jgi:hypothetical protein
MNLPLNHGTGAHRTLRTCMVFPNVCLPSNFKSHCHHPPPLDPADYDPNTKQPQQLQYNTRTNSFLPPFPLIPPFIVFSFFLFRLIVIPNCRKL